MTKEVLIDRLDKYTLLDLEKGACIGFEAALPAKQVRQNVLIAVRDV